MKDLFDDGRTPHPGYGHWAAAYKYNAAKSAPHIFAAATPRACTLREEHDTENGHSNTDTGRCPEDVAPDLGRPFG